MQDLETNLEEEPVFTPRTENIFGPWVGGRPVLLRDRSETATDSEGVRGFFHPSHRPAVSLRGGGQGEQGSIRPPL